MSDRELLEAAAKAAGMTPKGFTFDGWVKATIDSDGTYTVWNPLLDDGDAFRLAVRLRIDVVHPNPADLGGGYVTTRFRKPKYVELPIKETGSAE